MKLEDLLKIQAFEIGEDSYESTLLDDLFISTDDPNGSLANQAKLMVQYGFAFEQSLAHERELADRLERMDATLDYEARSALNNAGVKFTEKMVANTILLNEHRVALNQQLLVAKSNSGLLKAALNGIAQRKDTAVTIAHNLRAEMKNLNSSE
jgi:hypothetical protein